MATVTRSTKPNGSSSWATNDLLTAAGLNGDVDNIVTQVNGNLNADNIAAGGVDTSELAAGAVTNAKVDASAAIAFSKMDQTSAGALDSDVIDDYSDNAATARTVTSPGDSSSPSLATTLDGELERLRYTIKRMALGVKASITNGSSDATWYDGNAIGPNLLYNGSFLDNSATPTGWTVDGSPTVTVTALASADLAEGRGKYLALVNGSGATSHGLSQSFTPKRSGIYLVSCRVRDNTADVKLTTTGGTGTFGNIDQTGSAGAWQTLAGVVQADTTPTAIDVKINPTAANYDFDVAWVDVREISQDDLGKRGGEITLYKTSNSNENGQAAFGTVEGDLDATVVVPGPGYKIVVDLTLHMEIHESAANTEIRVDLDQSVDAASFTAVASTNFIQEAGASTGYSACAHLVYVNESPTPGSTYRYVPDLTNIGTAPTGGEVVGLSQLTGVTHTLVVRLVRS